MTHRANCFTCKYSTLSDTRPLPFFAAPNAASDAINHWRCMMQHEPAQIFIIILPIFFSHFSARRIYSKFITSIMCAIWNKFQWKSMPMRYTCIVCLLNVHESFAVDQQRRVLLKYDLDFEFDIVSNP